MRTRSLSALVYAALFLGLAWRGGLAWTAFVCLLSLQGLREGLNMARLRHLSPSGGLVLIGGGLLPLAAGLGGAEGQSALGLAIVGLAGVAQLARPATSRSLADWLASAALPLAIGWPLAQLVRLRGLSAGDEAGVTSGAGLAWLLALLLLIWTNDSAAYLAGRSIGRRPLLPSVSPKKTWEGFFAGLAACALLGAYLPALMARFPQAGLSLPGLSAPGGLLLGLAIGVIGPLGDLVESLLKRQAGIKDSGDLIPGHGGILDRVDSLLLAAPFTFYIALYLLGQASAAP